MTATCPRCGADNPLALSSLCPGCNQRRSAAKDTARLFSRRAVRHRRRRKRKKPPEPAPWYAGAHDVPLANARPDLNPTPEEE